MARDIFDDEHEAFRSAVGTFLDKEVVPFHDQVSLWKKASRAEPPNSRARSRWLS